MNRLIAITGMALLTAGLIGWVALACAQSNLGKLTSADEPSGEASATETEGESGPSGATTIKPRANGPAASLPGTLPMSAPMGSALPTGTPNLSPLPSNAPGVKGPAMMPLSPLPQRNPAAGTPLGPMPKEPATSPGLPMQPLSPVESALPKDGPLQKPGEKAVGPTDSAQPLRGGATGAVLPPLGSISDPNGLPAATAASPAANEEHGSDLTMTSEGSGNRQEPAVSLEWVGPATAKVSQPNNYTLVVRNICNIPVQQVLVRVRIPSGLSCGDTEPKAVAESNVLVWELGALQAQRRKSPVHEAAGRAKGRCLPASVGDVHRLVGDAHQGPRAEAGAQGTGAA